MVPKTQSIFHLGDEGGAHHHHGGSLVADFRRPVVGLQILVHQQQHSGHAASVILKQVVRPRAAAYAGHHHAVSSACSFLKACSMCRAELCHTKDVYMYRGDQGFCSEECRWKQIVVDESREREAMSKVKERRGIARHHSPHNPPIRGRPTGQGRCTLAVRS